MGQEGAVDGHPTPLVLVVCEDAERVYRLRTELRSSGFLPAFARSASMAASLFTQIRIEAVVLCPGNGLGPMDPLLETVRERDGLPAFIVASAAPPGWTACTEEQLLVLLRAIFGVRPDP